MIVTVSLLAPGGPKQDQGPIPTLGPLGLKSRARKRTKTQTRTRTSSNSNIVEIHTVLHPLHLSQPHPIPSSPFPSQSQSNKSITYLFILATLKSLSSLPRSEPGSSLLWLLSKAKKGRHSVLSPLEMALLLRLEMRIITFQPNSHRLLRNCSLPLPR